MSGINPVVTANGYMQDEQPFFANYIDVYKNWASIEDLMKAKKGSKFEFMDPLQKRRQGTILPSSSKDGASFLISTPINKVDDQLVIIYYKGEPEGLFTLEQRKDNYFVPMVALRDKLRGTGIAEEVYLLALTAMYLISPDEQTKGSRLLWLKLVTKHKCSFGLYDKHGKLISTEVPEDWLTMDDDTVPLLASKGRKVPATIQL